MPLVLLLGTLAWPLAAQESSKAANADGKQAKRQENSTFSEARPPASGGRQGAERYRLQPGDVVELSFAFTPDFNQTLSIGPDGFVTFRDVGDVRAEGYTTDELAQTAESRYAPILHDPMVTVTLKDFEKPSFIVGGEVEHPGKFELRGRTTLTEAVAIAGGFRDTAKHSDVMLFRRVSNDWASARKIDLKKMLRAGNLSEDPELEPGDMLFVPKNAISKIKPFIPVVGLGAYANPARF
jgi:polysaccharide export outer membrane protein